MSLLTYDDVRPWARSIKRKVTSREMSPWGADPRYGKFKDDQSLSAAQIETIARWHARRLREGARSPAGYTRRRASRGSSRDRSPA
jgi:hypothetical protein